MNKTIKNILMGQGYNLDEFIYIDKTCDNVKLLHRKTQKILDVRW
ncbi:hypothetical protein UT300003_32660 [Clostridium sardiniense]